MSDLKLGIQVVVSGTPEATASFSNLSDTLLKIEENTAKTATSLANFGDKSEDAGDKTASFWEKLTGLNAGLEILGKAKDYFFEAAGALGEFVSAGGEFHELKTSFEGLASSMGQDGDKIVSKIKDITDNTVSLEEAMKLGASAIRAGFGEEQQDLIFTFAKRLSEQGAGDFGSLSESIMTAMKTGRTAILETYGIAIEQGETVAQTFAKVKDRLGDMPAAGFNAKDAFTSLSISWKDFRKEFGDALNNVPSFGEALSSLAKNARDFVKEIDYKKVTEWVETGVQAVKGFAEEFGLSFEFISEWIAKPFESSDPKEFFTEVVREIGMVGETVVSTWNGIIELFQTLNTGNWFGSIMDGLTQLSSWVVGTVADLMTEIGKQVLDGMDAVITGIEGVALSFPNLAEKIGLTPEVFDSWKTLKDTAVSNLDGIQAGANSFAESMSGFGEQVFGNMNSNLEGLKGRTGDFTDMAEAAAKKIEDFEYKPSEKKVSKSFEEAGKKAGESFGKGLGSLQSAEFDSSIKKLLEPLTDFSGSKEAFEKQVREIEKSFQSLKEESLKNRKEELEEAVKVAEQAYGSKSDQVKKLKELQKDELDSAREYWTKATDAFKENLTDQKDQFKGHIDDEKKLREDALDHMKKLQEDEREELEKTLKAEKANFEERQTNEERDFKRRQEMQRQQLDAQLKGKPEYEQALAQLKQFQEDERFAFEQGQKRKKMAFDEEVEDRKRSLKEQQTATVDAFRSSGEAVDGLRDKTKSAAAQMAEAFRTNMKELPQTLSDSFRSVNELSKEYLQVLEEDPFSNSFDRKIETRKLLDEQRDIQERLVKSLERLAEKSGKKAEVSVTVDGVDNAIKELLKKLLEEAFIQAETEGTLVSAA